MHSALTEDNMIYHQGPLVWAKQTIYSDTNLKFRTQNGVLF